MKLGKNLIFFLPEHNDNGECKGIKIRQNKWEKWRQPTDELQKVYNFLVHTPL